MKPIRFGNGVDAPHHLLNLPVDIATESIALLGRRGSGKSHGARVIVEGVLAAEQQVVVFDPLNVWWGLRLSQDGGKAGYGVYIFGGDHADHPLVEQSGVLIADFVIDTGSSVVLSLLHLSKAASRRFVADFIERLMERKAEGKHRTVCQVVIDESDIFMPQRIQPEATRCFGICDDLVRRGRSRGLGTVLISQRPAVLNKDVLAMTEILVCLQIVAPQDRKALLAWVEANASELEAADFLKSLPTLGRGEAWIWSPSLLKTLKRIQIVNTSTYDSSYTPKVGEKQRAGVELKPVDMAKLTAQLQAVAKDVEENKPGKLKAEIARLRKELENKLALSPNPMALHLEFQRGRKEGAEAQRIEFRNLLTTPEVGMMALSTIVMAMDQVEVGKGQPTRGVSKELWDNILANAAENPIAQKGKAIAQAVSRTFRVSTVQGRPGQYPDPEQTTLGKAERAILTVLCHYGERSKEFVAAHAGYSVSGHFENQLGALRTKEYIVGPGNSMQITPAGKRELGDVPPLPTGDELWQQWMNKLGKCEKAILEALRANGPLTKNTLAAAAKYSVSGHFENMLGAVRSLGLVAPGNPISLTHEFEEAIS